ncbi:GNAT family N-acetyltransferase [Acholeplasma sp. OttesenSCG-928-E16]|nr:GNAT family N-acetyltransferase [Acholeplasma sp. OttesenSCG-928-E16]
MKSIETKRLLLRKPEIEDLRDFNYYAKKPNIGPMAGWSPHLSLAESEFILTDMIINDEVYAIIYKENKKMIGTIGIHPYLEDDEAKELGYVISDDYWGQGIAVEAARAVIDELFKDPLIKRIYCGYFSFNTQSKRVIEKLGFRYLRTVSDEKYKTYSNKQIYNILTKKDYEGKK